MSPLPPFGLDLAWSNRKMNMHGSMPPFGLEVGVILRNKYALYNMSPSFLLDLEMIVFMGSFSQKGKWH